MIIHKASVNFLQLLLLEIWDIEPWTEPTNFHKTHRQRNTILVLFQKAFQVCLYCIYNQGQRKMKDTTKA